MHWSYCNAHHIVKKGNLFIHRAFGKLYGAFNVFRNLVTYNMSIFMNHTCNTCIIRTWQSPVLLVDVHEEIRVAVIMLYHFHCISAW